VTPGYFDVVGIPIVRGRTFADAEMTDAAGVVIVTEATARNFWPRQDPIGQTLSMSAGPDRDIALTVVGVAKDAQVTSIGQIEPYYLYLPAAPRVAPLLRLLVKSRASFAWTAASIRAAVRSLDPGVAVSVSPLEANLDYWRGFSTVLTALAAALGALALVLASVGINGVVSYFVGRRTREIGIRMALGARAHDVVAMILKRTMRPVVIGAVIGIVAAVAVSNLLASVLFGVSPVDPIGIGAPALFVLAVALAAGILPGRRAGRAQPMAALHCE
jgi:hypothetical protein